MHFLIYLIYASLALFLCVLVHLRPLLVLLLLVRVDQEIGVIQEPAGDVEKAKLAFKQLFQISSALVR